MSTHAALNQLDGFTFGDGVYYADLTNLLGSRTLASAALESQENDGEAADLTVGTPTVLTDDTDVYDGPNIVATIATGKGFSVSISGGGVALYTLQFSFIEAVTGNVDGVEVQFNVR